MSSIHRSPSMKALVAALLCVPAALAVHAADATAVVSQNLKAATASTKIVAAIWTRRGDRYTLQIVFPRWSELILVEGRQLVAPHATRPSVTVWLLRADGTAIPTKGEPPLEGAAKNVLPTETAYSVSLSAGEEAVAAAIRIDDEYYVEPLQSLAAK